MISRRGPADIGAAPLPVCGDSPEGFHMCTKNGVLTYMSIEAITWALEKAPDVPAQALGVLMGLANHADEHGCGAWPDQETLALYARKSDRQCRSDLARLEELGLIRRGDQSMVEHLRADKRPVVWDLALDRRRDDGRKPTSGGKHTSGGKSRAGDGDTAGSGPATGSTQPAGSGVPAGSTASSDRKPTSGEPSVEPSGSSLPTGENTNAHTREGPATRNGKPPRRRRTKPELDELDKQAKDLAEKFFERHKTAQQFIAVLKVIRAVLGNGFTRDEVAFALDRLGRENKPVSGASIQYAYGQIAEERANRSGNSRASPSGSRVYGGSHIDKDTPFPNSVDDL